MLLPNKKTQAKTEPKIKSTPNNEVLEQEGVSIETNEAWKSLFSSYSNSFNTKDLLNLSALYQSGSTFVNDPYMMNSRMKRLSSRPTYMDRDVIEQALIAPQESELELRNATHSMLYMTYPMYRLQMLYEGILTYNNYIEPLYVTREEMNTDSFKQEAEFMDRWNKKLNAKKQFRKITGQIMAEGKKAYYPRQSYKKNKKTGKSTVDYVFFQELPSDWYKIVRHSTDSLFVVAFNFSYFWTQGDVNEYPPIFAKYLAELNNITVITDNNQKIVDIDRAPNNAVIEYSKQNSAWNYWVELPADECFVFAFTETDELQISPFIALLLQAQDLSTYSLLQQQLLSIPLYSFLIGELPMATQNKAGARIDDFGISPDAVNLFERKMNQQMPPGTSYGMTPSVNNKLFNFQEVPNANEIYTKGLQQLISTAGLSTLFTTTDKPSVAQVNAGKTVEKRFVDRIYEQFAWAVNIMFRNMKKAGDLEFDWNFRIFGGSFEDETNKESMQLALNMGQTYLMPKFLSYNDMSLLDAVTSADWVESVGLYDRFKPLVNTFTSVAGTPGREEIPEDEIDNDATAAGVDAGTNTADMRR